MFHKPIIIARGWINPTLDRSLLTSTLSPPHMYSIYILIPAPHRERTKEEPLDLKNNNLYWICWVCRLEWFDDITQHFPQSAESWLCFLRLTEQCFTKITWPLSSFAMVSFTPKNGSIAITCCFKQNTIKSHSETGAAVWYIKINEAVCHVIWNSSGTLVLYALLMQKDGPSGMSIQVTSNHYFRKPKADGMWANPIDTCWLVNQADHYWIYSKWGLNYI